LRGRQNPSVSSGQILAAASWIQQVIQYLGVRRAKHFVVTPIHDLPNIKDRFWRAIDGQVDPTRRRYNAGEAVGASSPAAMNATDFRWRYGPRFGDHRSDCGSPLLVSIHTAAPKKSFRTRLPDRQSDISNASARRAAGSVRVPGCPQPNDPPSMPGDGEIRRTVRNRLSKPARYEFARDQPVSKVLKKAFAQVSSRSVASFNSTWFISALVVSCHHFRLASGLHRTSSRSPNSRMASSKAYQ